METTKEQRPSTPVTKTPRLDVDEFLKRPIDSRAQVYDLSEQLTPLQVITIMPQRKEILTSWDRKISRIAKRLCPSPQTHRVYTRSVPMQETVYSQHETPREVLPLRKDELPNIRRVTPTLLSPKIRRGRR